MNQSLDSALTEAYTLIEDDNPDQAKILLEPYLSEYPDDPDLWWVYLHALEEPDQAQQALDKVLALDPSYPGAENLAAELNMKTDAPPTPNAGGSSLRRLRPSQPTPPTLPDETASAARGVEDFDDDFELDEPDQSPNLLVPLLSIIGVLVVLVLAFFAFQFFIGSDGAPPTQISQDATDATETPALGAANVTDVATSTATPLPTITADATAEDEVTEEVEEVESTEGTGAVEVGTTVTEDVAEESETEDATETTTDVPTEEPEESDTATPTETDEPEPTDTPQPTVTPTDEPTATATASPTATEPPSLEDQVSAAFEDFDLYTEEPTASVDAADGETFLVTICLNPGENRGMVLSDAMVTLANSNISYPDNVTLAGIELFDCEAEQRLRAVAAPLRVIDNFAQGTIERDQFQLAWRAVR